MSENSLDQLIASLKSEGIEVAEKESKKILDKARHEALQIVQSAEEQKENLLAEAKREAEAILNKGEAALRQAGRDYSISVRNALLNVFHTVLVEETRKEFTPDLLKTAIVKIIENINSDIELTLSSDYYQELADYIHDRFKSSEKLISVVEDNTVLNGFSVTQKDQGWSYSISPEEVAEALQNHLNKNWIDILNKES